MIFIPRALFENKKNPLRLNGKDLKTTLWKTGKLFDVGFREIP